MKHTVYFCIQHPHFTKTWDKHKYTYLAIWTYIILLKGCFMLSNEMFILDQLAKPTDYVADNWPFLVPKPSLQHFLSFKPTWAFWNSLVLEPIRGNWKTEICFISTNITHNYVAFSTKKIHRGYSHRILLQLEPTWAFWNPLLQKIPQVLPSWAIFDQIIIISSKTLQIRTDFNNREMGGKKNCN